MRFAVHIGALGVATSLAVLGASAPAAAAPKRITGNLSKPGYTVIAVAANGSARSVVAKQGKFRLRPPAKRVSLHMRTADGVYGGPVVIRGKGRRAIVGVMAGARLGRIDVQPGYARLARRLPRRLIDATRKARAKKGVPIGARRFGRVRSRTTRGPEGDADFDGIPDPLDIDDDGDLILDNLDRSPSAARASQAEERFDFHTSMTLYMDQTVNANAAALTVQQIDAALSSYGLLMMQILPPDPAELDCAGDPKAKPPRPGLIYCTRGGTGTVFEAGVERSNWAQFPECCDPDGDGLGTLQHTQTPSGNQAFFLPHGATTAQIRTGDVLIQRVTRAGTEIPFPATLQYVFATVPALVSYDDGQSAVTISYPVTHPDPATGRGGGPGTRENPIPVAADPNGDVVLTLKFWRPQRRRIAGEQGTSEWIDIGRLNYGTGVADIGGSCPQSVFSESDPSLGPLPSQHFGPSGGFADLTADQPANPANTLTYTVNLTKCLASNGLSWNVGEKRGFSFLGTASNGPDGAQQDIFFKRQ